MKKLFFISILLIIGVTSFAQNKHIRVGVPIVNASGTGTLTSIGYVIPAEGLTITGTNPITSAGVWTFGLSHDLSAIEALTGTGFAVRTGTSAWSLLPFTSIDTSFSNEIQTLSLVGNVLTLSNGGGSVTLPSGGGGGSATDLTWSGSGPYTLNSSDGTDVTITLAPGLSGSVSSTNLTITPVDGSTTNEIQSLSLSGQFLGISGGGTGVTIPVINVSAGPGISVSNSSGTYTVTNTGDNDNNSSNEIQTLSFNSGTGALTISSGNTVTITAGGGSSTDLSFSSVAGGVNLLSSSGNDVIINNTAGATWTQTSGFNLFLTLADNSATNELQTLSIAGNNLTISGGNTVVLPGAAINGSGGINFIPIWTSTTSLGSSIMTSEGSSSSLKIGTAASGAYKLYFGDGAFVYVGEDVTDDRLRLRGSSLVLEIGSGNVGTNGQALMSNGTTASWTTPADGSATNELQTISLAGNVLTLSNGGGSVTLPSGSGPTDLSVVQSGSNFVLNSSTGLDATIVQGSGLQFTVNSSQQVTIANTGDLSSTNEGILGVGAGSSTSSVITSNTSGAAGVTLNVSSPFTISESTSSNGGSITLGYNGTPGTVTAITVTTGTGLLVSGSTVQSVNTSGTFGLSLSNDVGAIEALFTTGIAVRYGTDLWTTRTLAVGPGLSITNADGLSGNPTISLSGGGGGSMNLSSSSLFSISGTSGSLQFTAGNGIAFLPTSGLNSTLRIDAIAYTSGTGITVSPSFLISAPLLGGSYTTGLPVYANGGVLTTAPGSQIFSSNGSISSSAVQIVINGATSVSLPTNISGRVIYIFNAGTVSGVTITSPNSPIYLNGSGAFSQTISYNHNAIIFCNADNSWSMMYN